jgi:hypothetical protein
MDSRLFRLGALLLVAAGAYAQDAAVRLQAEVVTVDPDGKTITVRDVRLEPGTKTKAPEASLRSGFTFSVAPSVASALGNVRPGDPVALTCGAALAGPSHPQSEAHALCPVVTGVQVGLPGGSSRGADAPEAPLSTVDVVTTDASSKTITVRLREGTSEQEGVGEATGDVLMLALRGKALAAVQGGSVKPGDHISLTCAPAPPPSPTAADTGTGPRKTATQPTTDRPKTKVRCLAVTEIAKSPAEPRESPAATPWR